jgi:riboflavin kinase / FMN adenylyltransferase
LTRIFKLKDIKKDQFKDAYTLMVIGFFDGVHRGHQKIIKMCCERASESGGISVALTFDRPPVNILKSSIYKKLIIPYEEKINIIKKLGIEFIVTAEIGMDFLNLSPKQFCDSILKGLFYTKELFIGQGFRFGKGAGGDTAFLKQYMGSQGVAINEIRLVRSRGEVISSTIIRKYYKDGNIERVNELLGRDPYIKGIVVEGTGRGRELGFPTANIDLPDKLIIPGDGVYFGTVTIIEDGIDNLKALINVGKNPTFGEGEKLIESHLLDFNDCLYGKEIKVTFLKKLRKEVRFKNSARLVEQIKKDISDAEFFFKHS